MICGYTAKYPLLYLTTNVSDPSLFVKQLDSLTVECVPADGHVFAVDALCSRGDGDEGHVLHLVAVRRHDDAGQHFAPTVLSVARDQLAEPIHNQFTNTVGRRLGKGEFRQWNCRACAEKK